MLIRVLLATGYCVSALLFNRKNWFRYYASGAIMGPVMLSVSSPKSMTGKSQGALVHVENLPQSSHTDFTPAARCARDRAWGETFAPQELADIGNDR